MQEHIHQEKIHDLIASFERTSQVKHQKRKLYELSNLIPPLWSCDDERFESLDLSVLGKGAERDPCISDKKLYDFALTLIRHLDAEFRRYGVNFLIHTVWKNGIIENQQAFMAVYNLVKKIAEDDPAVATQAVDALSQLVESIYELKDDIDAEGLGDFLTDITNDYSQWIIKTLSHSDSLHVSVVRELFVALSSGIARKIIPMNDETSALYFNLLEKKENDALLRVAMQISDKLDEDSPCLRNLWEIYQEIARDALSGSSDVRRLAILAHYSHKIPLKHFKSTDPNGFNEFTQNGLEALRRGDPKTQEAAIDLLSEILGRIALSNEELDKTATSVLPLQDVYNATIDFLDMNENPNALLTTFKLLYSLDQAQIEYDPVELVETVLASLGPITPIGPAALSKMPQLSDDLEYEITFIVMDCALLLSSILAKHKDEPQISCKIYNLMLLWSQATQQSIYETAIRGLSQLIETNEELVKPEHRPQLERVIKVSNFFVARDHESDHTIEFAEEHKAVIRAALERCDRS